MNVKGARKPAVAAMARVSDVPIKTFSIGFDDDAYNELKFARQVADRIVFMDNGEIVDDAPPEQFFNNPRSERTGKVWRTRGTIPA